MKLRYLFPSVKETLFIAIPLIADVYALVTGYLEWWTADGIALYLCSAALMSFLVWCMSFGYMLRKIREQDMMQLNDDERKKLR